MQLNQLRIMQANLRYSIEEMIEYVENGGLWTNQSLKEYYNSHEDVNRISPLIAISHFEDGLYYIHDGLHRCTATYLAGRTYLLPDEYKITMWTYNDYLEIAPDKNWFTPFNPLTHVRLADFAQFKIEAKKQFEENYEDAINWINQHKDDYCTVRTINYISDFANYIKN